MNGSAKLKEWLDEHRVSVAHLAERVGVTRQAVEDWARGSKTPRARHAHLLERATAYVSPDDTMFVEPVRAEDWLAPTEQDQRARARLEQVHGRIQAGFHRNNASLLRLEAATLRMYSMDRGLGFTSFSGEVPASVEPSLPVLSDEQVVNELWELVDAGPGAIPPAPAPIEKIARLAAVIRGAEDIAGRLDERADAVLGAGVGRLPVSRLLEWEAAARVHVARVGRASVTGRTAS